MVKVMECPDCGCVMKCTAWYVNDDGAGVAGTGDFECRNCGCLTATNRVRRVSGYESEVFEGVPQDIGFHDFLDMFDEEDISD